MVEYTSRYILDIQIYSTHPDISYTSHCLPTGHLTYFLPTITSQNVILYVCTLSTKVLLFPLILMSFASSEIVAQAEADEKALRSGRQVSMLFSECVIPKTIYKKSLKIHNYNIGEIGNMGMEEATYGAQEHFVRYLNVFNSLYHIQ